MGRSVSYPTGAIVAFASFEVEDPEDAQFEQGTPSTTRLRGF